MPLVGFHFGIKNNGNNAQAVDCNNIYYLPGVLVAVSLLLLSSADCDIFNCPCSDVEEKLADCHSGKVYYTWDPFVDETHRTKASRELCQCD